MQSAFLNHMLFHENVLLNDDEKITHYVCDKITYRWSYTTAITSKRCE